MYHGGREDAETGFNAEITKITERFDAAPQSGGRRMRGSKYKPDGFAPGLHLDPLILLPGPPKGRRAKPHRIGLPSAISEISALIVVISTRCSVSSLPGGESLAAAYPKVVNRLPDAYRRRPRSKTSAARRRYAIATASRIITFVNDGACRIRTGR